MEISKIRKHVFSFEWKLLLIGCTLFLAACIINTLVVKPSLVLSKQDTAININQNLLKYINFGNKRLFTDVIWIQTLIESDVERYKKKDLNNWLFLRFNTISILDPKFYENYLYGGQFLAIIKDDLPGASIIYDRGLKFYPEDYWLNYNAGFLNYYEMGNNEKGIKYLSKIENHPRAPVFIRSIVNKLKLASGIDIHEIYALVKHNYETSNDKTLRVRLQSDLYSLKAEIDLSCLNNGKPGCSYYDFDGKPYILKDGQYYTSKPFLRYRINKRSQTSSDPQIREYINTIDANP